jgi:hypothetical protein
MKTMFTDMIGYVPFVGMIIGNKEHSPMITRLLEAGIIGLIVMYGVQNVQSEQISTIRESLNEIRVQNTKVSDTMIEMRIDIEILKNEAATK